VTSIKQLLQKGHLQQANTDSEAVCRSLVCSRHSKSSVEALLGQRYNVVANNATSPTDTVPSCKLLQVQL
jgi:hypothetical protein